MKQITFPDQVKFLPEVPGIYQFRDLAGDILYIGKAKNLRSRVRSYTALKLNTKTARMVSGAVSLSFIEVQSEFEALLLEAKLVRAHMPLFNIELKDDKSPLYIGITAEDYPRILTLRQTQLDIVKLKRVFGPFVDGASAKYVLRQLRNVIPFSTHRVGKRACIYNEIGLCDPCPSEIANEKDLVLKKNMRRTYLRNITRLSAILNGNFSKIRKELEADMLLLSKREDFEQAAKIKERLTRLHRTLGTKSKTEEYIADPNFLEDIHAKELLDLTRIINLKRERDGVGPIPIIKRIECFDIAHLSGTNPTASMVTFTDGAPDKTYYRHFKINKGKDQNSDVDSMQEVLLRRSKHFEDWGTPDLMLIDGGKAQVAASHAVMKENFPIVGLAKRYETLVFEFEGKFTEYLLPEGPAKNLVVRLRNEAHRFARRLHHKQVTKRLLGK